MSQPLKVTANPYGKVVYFTDCRKTFAKLTKTQAKKYRSCLGLSGRHKQKGLVIGVFDGELATLVHECVHGAIDILERSSVDPCSSNAEPLAYLTDWLFSVGVKYLKRRTQ
jgi:hypothetical protein